MQFGAGGNGLDPSVIFGGSCPALRTHHQQQNHRQNHRRAREHESAEMLDFRKTVLRHFKCPFEEEDACLFSASPGQCLFAHVGNSTGSSSAVESDLKEVPPYVCIYNLVNSCYFDPPTVQNPSNSSSSNSSSSNLATPISSNLPNSSNRSSALNGPSSHPKPCRNGLHLSVEEMVDLEYFERANRQTIHRFFGADADRQCGVCLDTVLSKRLSRNRKFAILENCTHCFCAQCISAWMAKGGGTGEVACPMCRTTSARVLYRRRFTDKPENKRKLFVIYRNVQDHSNSLSEAFRFLSLF